MRSRQIYKCGRPSFLESCRNDIEIKEKMVPLAGSQRTTSSNIGQDVFAKTPDDEKIRLSRDDRDFLAIMEDGVVRDENGNWIAPLPFRKYKPRLKNNLMQALQRARNLQRIVYWKTLSKRNSSPTSCRKCSTMATLKKLLMWETTKSSGFSQSSQYTSSKTWSSTRGVRFICAISRFSERGAVNRTRSYQQLAGCSAAI